jgi:hypothetical protein
MNENFGEISPDGPIVEPLTEPISFKMIVEASQARYRSLKRKPWQAFSQTTEVRPSICEKYLLFVLDNLPEYIPEEVVKSIRDEHPPPIIGVSVFMDNREMGAALDGVTPPYQNRFVIPSNLSGEQLDAWREGIWVLNEVATEILAQDIIKVAAGRSSTKYKRLLNYLANKTPNSRVTHKGNQTLKDISPDSNKIQQALVNCMLSGERTIIDAELNKIGIHDLDELAIRFGEKLSYGGQKLDIYPYGEKEPRIKKALDLTKNNLRSFISGMSSSNLHPGVIEVRMAPYIMHLSAIFMVLNRIPIDTIFAPISALLLYGVSRETLHNATRTPRNLIHEMCHYISSDTDHYGLRPSEHIKSD